MGGGACNGLVRKKTWSGLLWITLDYSGLLWITLDQPTRAADGGLFPGVDMGAEGAGAGDIAVAAGIEGFGGRAGGEGEPGAQIFHGIGDDGIFHLRSGGKSDFPNWEV